MNCLANRLLVWCCLLVVSPGLPAMCRAAETPSARRPNIVFILGDDMGVDCGIGCYGSDRKGLTPNLDALAAGGIRFERCFANAICGPTRCQLMTGRYPFRTGGWDNEAARSVLSKNEYPLARILSAAGYDTCSVGKWRQMAETPREWGFADYVMSPTANGYFWLPAAQQRAGKYTLNGQEIDVRQPTYFPDICQDHALAFIRRHAAAGSAAGRPFFLYYPTHLMHALLGPTPAADPSGMDAIWKENLIYLDKQIGQLVAELDRLGLREETLIVFAGDNGTATGRGTIDGRRISGKKHTMLEGGALTPLIMNWKGTAPGQRVVRDLVDFSDFLPTFAELVGASLPDSGRYDGQSFASLLLGEKPGPRKWVFVGCEDEWYVREAGWKLNQAGELFDMADAPFTEPLTPADVEHEAATIARHRLQAVMDGLNPASGRSTTSTHSATQRTLEKSRSDGRK